MIAIINVELHPQPTGPHTYEVRINREVVTRFVHEREEPLSVLFRKAAEACEGVPRVPQAQPPSSDEFFF